MVLGPFWSDPETGPIVISVLFSSRLVEKSSMTALINTPRDPFLGFSGEAASEANGTGHGGPSRIKYSNIWMLQCMASVDRL